MDTTTSENTTAVKAGQIFTDEEYDSLKKTEKKTEGSNDGIDWGFGKVTLVKFNISFEKASIIKQWH